MACSLYSLWTCLTSSTYSWKPKVFKASTTCSGDMTFLSCFSEMSLASDASRWMNSVWVEWHTYTCRWSHIDWIRVRIWGDDERSQKFEMKFRIASPNSEIWIYPTWNRLSAWPHPYFVMVTPIFFVNFKIEFETLLIIMPCVRPHKLLILV